MTFFIIMENEKDEQTVNDEEETTNSNQDITETSEKKVAKDLVVLTHVETKKQEISKETIQLADALKQKQPEVDASENLSNDEITILESFMGKRLFLSRIAIIANQSRMPLGIEPFKKADLESLLNGLIEKEYIISEIVADGPVYYLTEKGKEYVQ